MANPAWLLRNHLVTPVRLHTPSAPPNRRRHAPRATQNPRNPHENPSSGTAPVGRRAGSSDEGERSQKVLEASRRGDLEETRGRWVDWIGRRGGGGGAKNTATEGTNRSRVRPVRV
uniref:HIRA n=1 Tax=Arundo donax TaxID=35708 RepID=A0A0A9F5Q1_ARUDO